jgi:hypothetical protein
MSAEVIPFPSPAEPKPDCRRCKHSIAGDETYCRVFRETILFEDVAEECEVYERDVDRD